MNKLLSTVSLLAVLGIAAPTYGADGSVAPASAQAPMMKMDVAQTEANKHPCSCDHGRTQATPPASSEQTSSSRREPGGR